MSGRFTRLRLRVVEASDHLLYRLAAVLRIGVR
jgi:hypothetical protein